MTNCPRCNGSGKIGYQVPGKGVVGQGDGYVIEDVGGYGTRACECVRDIPAVPGKATWWESESIYRSVIDAFIYQKSIDVDAQCEVPRNERGFRVMRTAENAYYPPLVDMTVEEEKVCMHAETARELGRALIAAADACEKADELCRATLPEAEDTSVEIPW